MAPPSLNFVYGMIRSLQKKVEKLEVEVANSRRVLRLDELLPILPFESILADTSPLNADAAVFAPATMTDCNFASLFMDLYFDDNDVDDDGEQYKYDDVDIRAVVDLPAASVVPHDAHTSVDAAFHDASSKNTKQVHFHDDTAETVQSFNNFLQFDTDDFKSTMTTVATQALKPLQEELLEELRGFREELEELEHMKAETREELEHMKVETREDVDEEWIPNDDDIDEDAYEDKDDDDYFDEAEYAAVKEVMHERGIFQDVRAANEDWFDDQYELIRAEIKRMPDG